MTCLQICAGFAVKVKVIKEMKLSKRVLILIGILIVILVVISLSYYQNLELMPF